MNISDIALIIADGDDPTGRLLRAMFNQAWAEGYFAAGCDEVFGGKTQSPYATHDSVVRA